MSLGSRWWWCDCCGRLHRDETVALHGEVSDVLGQILNDATQSVRGQAPFRLQRRDFTKTYGGI